MPKLNIKKSVLFEKITPEDTIVKKISIEASQKRLSLQDALINEDDERAKIAVKEYRNSFNILLSELEKNRSKTILKEQPQFDWNFGSKRHMSSCWIWELLMIHAVGFDVNYNLGLKHSNEENFKSASKMFHCAGEYVQTIIQKILPRWTWKEDPSVHITFERFWVSKLYYIYALKDLSTLQFGLSSDNGITDKNIIKLLERIEGFNNLSMIKWLNSDNEDLMNWIRVSRAVHLANKNSKNEKFGVAIGTLEAWETVFNDLKNKSPLKTIMEILILNLNDVIENKQEWVNSNNFVHHDTIQTLELEDITSIADIKNEIKSL